MSNISFSRKLLAWSITFDRKMPWKDRSDPYAIWLSEIILQQTRVAQGLPYYLKFLEAFPTVQDLAQAPEQDIMLLWQGLGYYSRARNLHFTAKQVSDELNGLFPNSYTGLLSLKGVGPYTAAAIASFAYKLPHAVVDGNVFRVLSRYTANFSDIGTPVGKKEFTLLANQFLDKKQPGRFNQALMDLGALVCKPVKPICPDCPLHSDCLAFAQDIISSLPVKAKKIKKRTRYFYYLVFKEKDLFLIQKRTQKDIWQSLFEFPNIEGMEELNESEIREAIQKKYPNLKYKIKHKSAPSKQLLTHQKIIGIFLEIKATNIPDNLIRIKKSKIQDYPFPKMMVNYFK